MMGENGEGFGPRGPGPVNEDPMTGGTVAEIVVMESRVWVRVEEPYSVRECSLYLAKDNKSLSISEGDSLYWDSDGVLWNPKFKYTRKIVKHIPVTMLGVPMTREPKEVTYAKQNIPGY